MIVIAVVMGLAIIIIIRVIIKDHREMAAILLKRVWAGPGFAGLELQN